ncbi:MAG: HD domain-containing protein [Candidatus Liptonbacteria bacterium]|nr:HD domain-containing protein [Candidatus Liptonbacteria bacterium]
MKFTFPEEILAASSELERAGFKVYLVGGCVRDLLMEAAPPQGGEPRPAGREPKDWDITTDAKPEEIQKIFSTFAKASADKPGTVYENTFGTVGVKTDSDDPKLKIIEITTFRLEGKYTDKRHPDEVKFAETVEEDLSRRDFTINALALNMTGPAQKIVDPFGGQKDLRDGIIRAVGNAEDRFNEDALRMMRAVRFSTELGFQLDFDTRRAIEKLSGLLEAIAKERIRDEFEKIIMSDRAASGVILLEELNLLVHVLPGLRDGIGVGQNKHHIYTVFEHNVKSLDYSARQNYSLEVRLASLLHDLGKPKAKRGEGPNSTFHGHEVVGAKMAIKALEQLRFSKDVIENVAHLIRYHMFYYNVGEVSEAGVRRFIARVGPETVPDLFKLREADRIGSGVPKAVPYKTRHLLFMIEKVKNDPVSPKMLKLKGDKVMKILGIEPGPRVGQVLSILLEEVLDDPSRNEVEYLELRTREFGKLTDAELRAFSEKAKGKKEEFNAGIEEGMKEKFHVK